MDRPRLSPAAEGARVGAVLLVLSSAPVLAASSLCTGTPFPAAPLGVIAAGCLAAGALAAEALRSEQQEDAEWVTGGELLGGLGHRADGANSAQIVEQKDGLLELAESVPDQDPESLKERVDDAVRVPSMILPELRSSRAQGTPNPLAPITSVRQGTRESGASPASGTVLRTPAPGPLKDLPPLPAHPPTIHLSAPPVRSTGEGTPVDAGTSDPRSTLESRPLREAIADLGPEGYIEALDHCLALSNPGSLDVVLLAQGPVRGLGARGVRNGDGKTGFTRADVLKMRRRALAQVSATVLGDFATNGEG